MRDPDKVIAMRVKKSTLRATDFAGKMPYVRRTLDKKESGTVITDFEYELDKAGIRLSMKDKDGKYWAFGYDPRYQLRSETKWSSKTGGSRLYQYAWLYDPNGNRLVECLAAFCASPRKGWTPCRCAPRPASVL